MRLYEFATQTKTPEQLRIDTLKAEKDRVSQKLQTERQRQQVTKAKQKLAAVQQPLRQSKPNNQPF